MKLSKSVPAETRFWTQVNKTDGCWLWTGSTRRGYGLRNVLIQRSNGQRVVRPFRGLRVTK